MYLSNDQVSNVNTSTGNPKPHQDTLVPELKKQGLPEDLFTSPTINWIVLFGHSTAEPKTVQDIKEFIVHIRQTTHPKAAEDVIAFIADENRTNWDSHCPDVDAAWKSFLARVEEILGDDIAYIFASMAKTSGALGSILYIQWLAYLCVI